MTSTTVFIILVAVALGLVASIWFINRCRKDPEANLYNWRD